MSDGIPQPVYALPTNLGNLSRPKCIPSVARNLIVPVLYLKCRSRRGDVILFNCTTVESDVEIDDISIEVSISVSFQAVYRYGRAFCMTNGNVDIKPSLSITDGA